MFDNFLMACSETIIIRRKVLSIRPQQQIAEMCKRKSNQCRKIFQTNLCDFCQQEQVNDVCSFTY